MAEVLAEIQFIGLDELLAGLSVAPAAIEEGNRKAMMASLLLIEARAKGKVPRVTGRLFSSIHSAVTGTPSDLVGHVGTTVRYAPFVQNGRGPVVATNAKALRFKIGGKVMFRKRVGAAKARPFLPDEGMVSEMTPVVAEVFRKTAADILAAAVDI